MATMKTIELFGEVDEHHRLSAEVPADVPPGPVKLALVVPNIKGTGNDDAEAQWATGLAREWAEDLADPRQDIYTLADGEPIDEAR